MLQCITSSRALAHSYSTPVFSNLKHTIISSNNPESETSNYVLPFFGLPSLFSMTLGHIRDGSLREEYQEDCAWHGALMAEIGRESQHAGWPVRVRERTRQPSIRAILHRQAHRVSPERILPCKRLE
ncbi:uncharacterized protein DSM5745_00227 [Aspergillus mulundensis]|uniref:Uncharacterized protein n=1 Tax=Aspergillus mulundensis TaxID=1810919 RepID=A0A3D8T2W3_9EURO|nr:hypothetical protein DSM5745_00227 [Aspergillus mulundensis]RDW92905.1 hypothetical protein DSM5745_00227 [Aspergillus mulundensis]